ncbi:cell envelope integrity protein TolA [Solimicrobium silvestre]|uniref:TonB family C-terminal domain n=1 Tax=Solimicrobium silvestre TaxID=2099400 RepID=A0A2S9H5L3_9BURK|nr:cell envelope integrity protein TolA [Solimicrobium silvestre]PRC95274.1 TonB family C-terminal domain [Solimicrobium silvestre]
MSERVNINRAQVNGNGTLGVADSLTGSHYQIPKEPGRNSAFLLAGVMHVLLFMFLWIGIRWQSQEPVGVDAEIWDMTTREAAPLPKIEVAPPQPPEVEKTEPELTSKQVAQEQEQEQEAEIAIERARKQKIADEKLIEKKKIEDQLKEKQKEDQLKEKQKEEKLQEAKDEQKRKDDLQKDQKKQDLAKAAEQKKADALAKKQRDDNLKNLTSQVVGTGGTGDAVKSTGNNRVDPSYAGKIAAKIKSKMVYLGSDNGPDNPTVEFKIDLFPDGSLRGVPHKTKSSGVAQFDDAVDSAIRNAAPYPADKSGVVPQTIPLTYKLKD